MHAYQECLRDIRIYPLHRWYRSNVSLDVLQTSKFPRDESPCATQQRRPPTDTAVLDPSEADSSRVTGHSGPCTGHGADPRLTNSQKPAGKWAEHAAPAGDRPHSRSCVGVPSLGDMSVREDTARQYMLTSTGR